MISFEFGNVHTGGSPHTSAGVGASRQLFLGAFLSERLGLGSRSTSLKAFHAAGNVEHLVCPRVERVTLAADFYRNLLLCRGHGELRPAGSGGFGINGSFWMYICFH